jgi:hypothetical protein
MVNLAIILEVSLKDLLAPYYRDDNWSGSCRVATRSTSITKVKVFY